MSHYVDEKSYWDRKGSQPYSVLSAHDQHRMRDWISWSGQGAVLDLGGGSGALSSLLEDVPNTWSVCLDISYAMLEHSSGVRIQGDALSLPFASDSFSLIIAAALFHHLPRRAPSLLRECFRVLRPGGRLLGYDPSSLCLQNRLFMTGGPLRLNLFSPDERPIAPDGLLAAATAEGFCNPSYFPFSFHYQKLTPFEMVQRYILNPLARGWLAPVFHRWFFWQVYKPTR